jgi:type I restriction enzyme, R subunit
MEFPMVFSEKVLVEDYIVGKLQEIGWKFIPSDELDRDSYEEPLLLPNLARAIARINKKIGVGDEEIKRTINELTFTTVGVEGAKRILDFYKSGVPVKFEKEKVVKYVQVFDYDHMDNNEFFVTRQVPYLGREKIRTDIVLYVNGIPLVSIECKDPTNISESWHNAYRQIKTYEKSVPELYKFAQIGIAAESIAKYFPIVPWQDEANTHEWRADGKNSIDAALEILSHETLLDIIRNFLFFREEHGNATKVVARYMQYRAANKIVNRVVGNISGTEDKDKGLVWHWQGSGKTLTMIFAANKLYLMRELENPSIFFIVDRIELKDQLSDEFGFLQIAHPDVIDTTRELKDVLSHDDYRGKRGIFITLIHKFKPEELGDLSSALAQLSKRKETIMNRKNIIAFIDEGHRTQYGLLAAQMREILRSAFFFAFTGTPIAKTGRDTYLQFSYPPKELYLDRYFITDSQRDGFTVKIVYQPRLEKDVHLDKESLEDFLETDFEELPEEIREDVEEKVKRKLNTIKLILENPQRIEKIARDVVDHFRENVDGRFKAMVVAASRKACVMYKRELDKHLPPEYSEVLMTYATEDEPPLREYLSKLRARYGGLEAEDIRTRIIDNFKETQDPRILIVTDMLLTGFDAPVLQVMYLDKPLKEHRLLQAVARTNRPFKDLKEAGLVIDYVGVLANLEKALMAYSSNDVRGAILGFESVGEEFVDLVNETVGIFGGLELNHERETLLETIDILTSDESKEKAFVSNYRKLRRLFELLGPSPIKLQHVQAYKWLSAVYAYYLKMVLQTTEYDDYVTKYYEKTIRFAHGATEIEKLLQDLPTVAFDKQRLEVLETRGASRKEKAANVLFALNRLVLVHRFGNPISESLVDRVEKLLRMWREKNKNYEIIYQQGQKIVEDFNLLSDRQTRLGFSDLEYSILLVLESKLHDGQELVDEVKGLSQRLKDHMFPGWMSQATVKKAIQREIRRFARRLRTRYRLSFEEVDELFAKLGESVENYAG